jgi:hypothetical protein
VQRSKDKWLGRTSITIAKAVCSTERTAFFGRAAGPKSRASYVVIY